MSEHGHSSHGGGYEKRDTTARPIVLFGIGLLGLIVVSLLLMGGLFSYYNVRETRLDQSASPLGAVTLPPEPRLQVTSGQDLVGMRAHEDRKLDGYEWIDRDGGIVAIPVERAMDLVAERGLPRWTPTNEQ
jgi:hypothetical protein